MPRLSFAALAWIALLTLPRLLLAQDSVAEPVLLDVHIGEAASAIMEGQRNGDTVLLKAGDICGLAELRCTTAADDYIGSDSIKALLHARLTVDWGKSAVLISDCDALPVMRRHARALARLDLVARSRQSRMETPDFTVRRPLRPTGVVMLDYSLSAASASLASAVHNLGVGTALLAGAANAQFSLARSTQPAASRPSLVSASWVRAWDEAHRVRQLRVGDLTGAAANAEPVRGLGITNAPYRPLGDSIHVTGFVAPGHDVEAYRDGALVATTSAAANGSYSLWVPSQFGANSFVIVTYDQFGDATYEKRTVLVPPGALPAHSLRYTAAAGRCVRDYCRGDVSAGVSYAPSDRVTAVTSIELLQEALQRSRPDLHPGFGIGVSAQLLGRVSDALAASVAHTAQSTGVDVHFVPGPELDILAAYRAQRSPLPTLQIAERSGYAPFSEITASVSWRPSLPHYWSSINASAATLRSATRSTTAARLSLAVPLRTAYVVPFLHYDLTQVTGSGHFGGLSVGMDALVTPTYAPSLLARSILRLQLKRAPPPEPGSATVAISIPVIGQLRLEVQSAWSGAPRPVISFSIRESFAGFRLMSTVNNSPGAGTQTVHSLQGSVLLDLARRSITTAASGILGDASITGVVFIDQNRNGRRDRGEGVVPGAYVRAGDTGSLSNFMGEYTLDNLQPFAPVVIQLDALTLPSSSLTPLHHAIRADPVPNQLLRVDIPVIDVADAAPQGAPPEGAPRR